MKKYDMTPVKYLEPTFLPLARNRKSYVCPVCGSGSGRNGSGMTSRNGEYWTCWSCDKSYSKVELFRIKNSLSSYEEACEGLLRYYGLDPNPISEDDVRKSPVWLSRDDMDALGFYQGAIQNQGDMHALTDLFGEDPETYYKLVIARSDEMIRKYEVVLKACGDRKSPRASVVYDWLGDLFDDSSYGKVRQELERRIDACKKIRYVYAKRLREMPAGSPSVDIGGRQKEGR